MIRSRQRNIKYFFQYHKFERFKHKNNNFVTKKGPDSLFGKLTCKIRLILYVHVGPAQSLAVLLPRHFGLRRAGVDVHLDENAAARFYVLRRVQPFVVADLGGD